MVPRLVLLWQFIPCLLKPLTIETKQSSDAVEQLLRAVGTGTDTSKGPPVSGSCSACQSL